MNRLLPLAGKGAHCEGRRKENTGNHQKKFGGGLKFMLNEFANSTDRKSERIFFFFNTERTNTKPARFLLFPSGMLFRPPPEIFAACKDQKQKYLPQGGFIPLFHGRASAAAH